ncbi:glycosyltransferase [Microvirga sp. BT688]|uniref:glycosyltransferase n=1 Tax=Microvirga sp. TaxID=1873136 RepID=UPI0016838A13|nr:glycosyltransferase [Microvirga sp.]MBD2750008.1 glycosyltransferase [Microvirga sp.]
MVLDWGDTRAIRDSLQTHPIVIFYRVPGYPESLALINEAKRLGAATFWEVDDLIFDTEVYEQNRNVQVLDPDLKRLVLSGVPLFRAALQACDYGLASTDALATAMKAAGVRDAFVVENALDSDTMECAASISTTSRVPADSVTVIYGSGSKAHDADFECAAHGLLNLLEQRPHVRLRIVGHLNLPADFARFEDRIERVPFTDFKDYLEILASADISIAPLEATLFNDAKSNIKYLEASILGLPSVCSPRATFRSVVRHGVNGFLAETDDEWLETLLQLADEPNLRARLGQAAKESVLEQYHPDAIAKNQVAPLVGQFAPPRPRKLRILAANVFYNPQRFGGATIVAEELVTRLHARADTEVTVFTSWADASAKPYSLKRYEVGGVPVFAVKTPDLNPPELEYINPRMGEIFAEILQAVRPDVVHLHSIQGLSASLARACIDASVPYVITSHDAWWLCERQFMVKGDGAYCFQTRIDPAVCGRCVRDSVYNRHRTRQLRHVLDNASLVLVPSAFHRQLHLDNGVDPKKLVINKNGTRPPASARPPVAKDAQSIRFGFVGGAGPNKGLDLIRKAFEDLPYSNYELILVDNTLNLGFSSLATSDWRIPGKLTISPAYTQDTIDDFFNGIDVLLFPSQVKESFGLTVREALIRDVWVILTEAGGATEDIIDGTNGTLIPLTGHHVPLRTAIASLLQASDRLHMYRNPYKHRIATFEKQVDELYSLLNRAVMTNYSNSQGKQPIAQSSGLITNH